MNSKCSNKYQCNVKVTFAFESSCSKKAGKFKQMDLSVALTVDSISYKQDEELQVIMIHHSLRNKLLQKCFFPDFWKSFIFTFRSSLVGVVGRKLVVGISNSFYVVFAPLLAPIPNFIQIRWKTWKLKIFSFGRFWLVGLVGQKMVAATPNITLPSGRL